MAPEIQFMTPELASYLKSLRNHSAAAAVDHLVLLLRRRQIQKSRPCALAAIHLYLRVVAESKFKNSTDLLERVRGIGRRLQSANPHELVLGNITRRVLGLIREVNEAPAEDALGEVDGIFKGMSSTSVDAAARASAESIKPTHAPAKDSLSVRDMREDVLNGLGEMLDELGQADEQVAGYALEHIRPNETILTYTSSLTVQKFLLAAAKKRKFTVIHVEGYPNEHESTYDTIIHGAQINGQDRFKALISAGVTVIAVPDSAVFAVMPQVTKVLLPMHIAFSDGSFVAPAGSSTIAQVAKVHRVPVVILGAIYKLSPSYPYDVASLSQLGDPRRALGNRDGDLLDEVDVVNVTSDLIKPGLVNLFVTNIGAFAPSFLFRVAADHYRSQDIDFGADDQD